MVQAEERGGAEALRPLLIKIQKAKLVWSYWDCSWGTGVPREVGGDLGIHKGVTRCQEMEEFG